MSLFSFPFDYSWLSHHQFKVCIQLEVFIWRFVHHYKLCLSNNYAYIKRGVLVHESSKAVFNICAVIAAFECSKLKDEVSFIFFLRMKKQYVLSRRQLDGVVPPRTRVGCPRSYCNRDLASTFGSSQFRSSKLFLQAPGSYPRYDPIEGVGRFQTCWG